MYSDIIFFRKNLRKKKWSDELTVGAPCKLISMVSHFLSVMLGKNGLQMRGKAGPDWLYFISLSAIGGLSLLAILTTNSLTKFTTRYEVFLLMSKVFWVVASSMQGRSLLRADSLRGCWTHSSMATHVSATPLEGEIKIKETNQLQIEDETWLS